MIVAAVDVGNSTTEVVLAESTAGAGVPHVLAHDRAPTRGAKGSTSSLEGAAVLVGRLQRRVGRRADVVAAAPLLPVRTSTVSLPRTTGSTGRLGVVATAGDTHGGVGVGVGVPVRSQDPVERRGEPVVLLVERGVGFRAAAQRVASWARAGTTVAAVLLEDDEGNLVSSRLEAAVPVVDTVDVRQVAGAELVAVEVRPAGSPLHDLGDALRLSTLLGLEVADRPDAVAAVAALGDRSRAVVVRRARAAREEHAPAAEVGGITLAGEQHERPLSLEALAGLPVGGVRRWRSAAGDHQVDDLWAVGLREVATSVAAPVDATTASDLVLAGLDASGDGVDPTDALTSLLGLPVHLVGREADAARAGALTTPGATSGAVVVDLGGGTIDVAGPGGSAPVVAAGAGEMLTEAVGRYLRLPRGAADWVKRGPCARVEGPQVLLAEDGTRSFHDEPLDATTVGQLVVPGPAGPMAFDGVSSPALWRALRRRLKESVVADNVLRALAALPTPTAADPDLVLVGGPVGDEELLGIVRSALASRGPQHLAGSAVARGDVGPGLGHRYAVAVGLCVLTLQEES